jgi:hypothetical protein
MQFQATIYVSLFMEYSTKPQTDRATQNGQLVTLVRLRGEHKSAAKIQVSDAESRGLGIFQVLFWAKIDKYFVYISLVTMVLMEPELRKLV